MTANLRKAFFAVCILSAALASGAEVDFFPWQVDANDPAMGYLRLGVKRWYSRGTGMFRKSLPFPFATSPPIPPDKISMGSTLEYNGIDTVLDVYSAEVRPIGWFSADVEHGENRFSAGTSLDHDWINSPGYNLYSPSGYVFLDPHLSDFSESRSSLAGTTKLTEVHGYIRLAELREKSKDSTYVDFIDIFGGYFWYDDQIRVTNGVQIYEPDPFLTAIFGLPPPGPFPGLDTSFSFHWEGAEFGFREEWFFSSVLSSEGRFGFAPAARYSGEGVWNLRSDLMHNPSFLQSATGYGMDFYLDLAYTPVRSLGIRAGYMGTFLHASRGRDTVFFSDGTAAEDSLDKVRTERRGLFAAASLKF